MYLPLPLHPVLNLVMSLLPYFRLCSQWGNLIDPEVKTPPMNTLKLDQEAHYSGGAASANNDVNTPRDAPVGLLLDVTQEVVGSSPNG